MTTRRVLGTVLLVLLSLAGSAGAALATEGGAEIPNFTELATNPTAAEFLPEPYAAPTFFDWMIIPLLIIGVISAAYVLLRYLVWQPRFVREREEKLKSRR